MLAISSKILQYERMEHLPDDVLYDSEDYSQLYGMVGIDFSKQVYLENIIPSKASSVEDGEERMNKLLGALSDYDKQFMYDLLHNEGFRLAPNPTASWRKAWKRAHGA